MNLPAAIGRSGGRRPGAGRPRHGVPAKLYTVPAVRNAAYTPLEYMLAVMCDDSADVNRRDRMAMAAAPYCHPKLSDGRITKGELREQQAKESGEWSSDLVPGTLHAPTGKSDYSPADN